MGDSTGNIYYSGGSSRVPRSRQRANSVEHTIIPHLLAPLPCDPYLGHGENPENISVQFLHSCPNQDTTQLDSDILQPHISFDDVSATAVAYPESSQRTTSHSLSPYAIDASGFNDYSPCDLATLHATQTFRRGSWPSHSQTEYSPWMQSPPRMTRSPVSEPPESTSDESFQDSDVEEVTQMSPMMNQFQIQSSRNVDLPPQHMYHAQALQPSVMTFQLSESMLQPVDVPDNGQTLRNSPDMSVVADDESEFAHSSPSSTIPSSSISFGSTRTQGSGTRLQHDSERTNQSRVLVTTSSSIACLSPHSQTNAPAGDQGPPGPGIKQQKKAKMHQCQQCKKMFPRPSGLATHMNTHSGAKPYKCMVANCEKSFAVRSNAKRHLRTHGINPSSTDMLPRSRFTVGFEQPLVTQVHDTGRQPSRYRWIPHTPSSHEHEWRCQGSLSSAMDGVSGSGITFQASMSSTSSSAVSNGSDDEYDEVASSSVTDVHRPQGDYTDRDTDELSGTYPIYREHSRGGC